MVDYLRDLESTCSALGTNDGAGSYHKDEDCLECVKDLIRFLRRDDGNNHTLRRALGQIGVVKSDLLPILREYVSDDDLFDMVLRLIVNLTSPELLLFRQELPEDKITRNYFLQLQQFRQDYKAACVDEKLWHVLAQKLGGLLRKDFDERSEDDRLIIERILIFVRNILEVPRNTTSEKRTEDDATIHDQILWVLHKSGMEDLLLYIASSSDEAQYCLHVVEIISLMFREQDPKFLATANFQRSKDERQEDETALVRLRQQEEEKKKQKFLQKKSLRHSRFGGSYTLTNVKSISENPLIYHKPLSNLHNINFDENKRAKKVSKNRATPKDEGKRRSTLAIRLFLKEFCIEFLNGAYNQLMYVVKDNLNRQKAQQNDETYYLWALKFFMEFNRLHKFRVELVTETMSKSTFHYIHQQIEAYKDNYEHEKKNRPMCLTWARRMHLAIKAYQEILYNLLGMAQSKDESVRKSAMVLRADVFYEPEYRELCFQQLNIFNQTKMSLNYLKDLVETTHIFMKLMETMSKSGHLMVRSKKKTSRKKISRNKHTPGNSQNLSTQERNELIWDAISSQLSACVQGNVHLPTNISPFDAASDTPIDDQKLLAMIRIQDFMGQKKTGESVALLRAARDVWPENETFGPCEADAEDEFMVLREILFAEIPRPGNMAPPLIESSDESNPLDNIDREEIENEEDEADEEYVMYSTEQEFDYKSFSVRFAAKHICSIYALLFTNYEKNSDFTNHCIVKMFHRIAWDCGLPAMLFNISIFRTFQRIHIEYNSSKLPPLKELDRFAKYLLSRFFDTVKTNKKVFMETLFWSSNKEASEILEGYNNQTMSKRDKAVFWTEEDEETLERVFYQLKEAHENEDEEQSANKDYDLLDSITAHFEGTGKSRRQVGQKLKDLNLIADIKEVTVSDKNKASYWSLEDSNLLRNIFNEINETRSNTGPDELEHNNLDVLDQITVSMASCGKSRKQVAKKLKEMNLITNVAEVTSSNKNKTSAWSTADTESLQQKFYHLKKAYENGDPDILQSNDKDLLDSITSCFVNSGKTRRQVAKKLKELNLISETKEVTKKPRKIKTKRKASNDSSGDSSDSEPTNDRYTREDDTLDNSNSSDQDTVLFTSSKSRKKRKAKDTFSSEDDSRNSGLLKKPSSKRSTNNFVRSSHEKKNLNCKIRNEMIWEQISSELSACVQGKVDLPTDVSSAHLENSAEDQKVFAMRYLQKLLQQKQAGSAVSFLRSARKVWTDTEIFGGDDDDPEDEFMTLREILFMGEILPLTVPNGTETKDKSNNKNGTALDDNCSDDDLGGNRVSGNKISTKYKKIDNFINDQFSSPNRNLNKSITSKGKTKNESSSEDDNANIGIKSSIKTKKTILDNLNSDIDDPMTENNKSMLNSDSDEGPTLKVGVKRRMLEDSSSNEENL